MTMDAINHKPVATVSVRELVEYALMSGDISASGVPGSRAVEGILGHQAVQASMMHGYRAEVPVRCTVEGGSVHLEISGRVDGVIDTDEGVIIEEIKTTGLEPDDISCDHNPLHWAQVKCYAHMYGTCGTRETCDTCGTANVLAVQLTYYNTKNGRSKHFRENYDAQSFSDMFAGYAGSYIEMVESRIAWTRLRNASIAGLDFPFRACRDGQREFISSAGRVLQNGGKLFVQAPTGTGKTMAALYPAVKALGEGSISKIFYLTAKTVTGKVALEALEHMRCGGLRLKSVCITAKEKTCFSPGLPCSPEYCPFARGYYDRLRGAVNDIMQTDSHTRPVIEEYARKHSVCPFEFSLDLAMMSDCVICDYNYAFDPRIYLRRFFKDVEEDYAFLVDEAHNLVDRGREMFSASLGKKAFSGLKKVFSGEKSTSGRRKAKAGKSPSGILVKAISSVDSALSELKKTLADEGGPGAEKADKDPPVGLLEPLGGFLDACEAWFDAREDAHYGAECRDAVIDLYFKALSFAYTLERYDTKYAALYTGGGSDFTVKLFCMDPSTRLREAMRRSKAGIIFSATLSPMDYFVRTLGGDGNSDRLGLMPPFPRENLCLMLCDTVSTRYRMRESTYDEVAGLVSAVVSGKPGNYIAYFPSYKYLEEVFFRFYGKNPGMEAIRQRPGMNEQERGSFLEMFDSPSGGTLVGFAVMGGMFGEGIDLAGDRLSGVIIVGVGLPQVCFEREIIKAHFEEYDGTGFEFAYTYPGMNKVLQAVGRVIRTETDRGVALLIDERFSTPVYENLYPPDWEPLIVVSGAKQAAKEVRGFWRIAPRNP